MCLVAFFGVARSALLLLLCLIFFPGCPSMFAVQPGGSSSVVVSWEANREAAVNAAGGGYRVSWSRDPSFSSALGSLDVPYVAGATAPVTARIPSLTAGTYYVRIVAYSALNPGGSAPSTSAPIQVP